MTRTLRSLRTVRFAVAIAAALSAGACATNPNGDQAGLGGAGMATPGSAQDFVVNVGDRVFFETDSSDLTPTATATLDKQAQWLNQYRRYAITIEGHADERGTREYNFALGARRAQAVRDYLAARGVSAQRMRTDLLRQGTAGRGVQRHLLLVAEPPRGHRARRRRRRLLRPSQAGWTGPVRAPARRRPPAVLSTVPAARCSGDGRQWRDGVPGHILAVVRRVAARVMPQRESPFMRAGPRVRNPSVIGTFANRLIASTGLVATGFLAALAVAPANAQSDDMRPPSEVGSPLAHCSAPAAARAAGRAELVVRVNRLEGQIRQLSGQIEQLQFQNKRLEEQLAKFQEDVEFRFQELAARRRRPPAARRRPARSPRAAAGAAPAAQDAAQRRVRSLRRSPSRRARRARSARCPAAAGRAAAARLAAVDPAEGDGPIDLTRMSRASSARPPASPRRRRRPRPSSRAAAGHRRADPAGHAPAAPRQRRAGQHRRAAAAARASPQTTTTSPTVLVLQRQYDQAEMAFRQFLQSYPRDKHGAGRHLLAGRDLLSAASATRRGRAVS